MTLYFDQQQRAAMEGLRGIAILMVLLYHLTPGANPNRGLESIVFKVAHFGWSGVDLFLVLSGFLITSILIQSKPETLSLKNFFVRRALRILPVSYLALLTTFFFVPLFLHLYPIPSVKEQWPYWLFLSNYHMPGGEFGEYFKLGHMWSLALEMQFYFVWPVVLIAAVKRNILRLMPTYLLTSLIVLVCLRAAFVSLNADWSVTFSWLPLRMDGLLIGSFLAISRSHPTIIQRHRTNISFLVSLTFIIVGYIFWKNLSSAIFKQPVSIEIFATRAFFPAVLAIFYGSVLWLTLEFRQIGKTFSTLLFRLLGKYSYSIYVVHFLMVPLFLTHIKPTMDTTFGTDTDLAIYAYFTTASLISIVLAATSFHLMEKPILDQKHRFPVLNYSSQ